MWIPEISQRHWWLYHFGPGSGSSKLQSPGLFPEEAAGGKSLSTALSPGFYYQFHIESASSLFSLWGSICFTSAFCYLCSTMDFFSLFFLNWWVSGFDLMQYEESCLPFQTKQESRGRLNIPATARICSQIWKLLEPNSSNFIPWNMVFKMHILKQNTWRCQHILCYKQIKPSFNQRGGNQLNPTKKWGLVSTPTYFHKNHGIS